MEYIIVFHDDTTLAINKNQADMIASSKSTELRIGGSIYKRSSISKILTLNDFFQQYPQKRPEEKKDWVLQEIIPLTDEQIKAMRKGLLKGLKNYIDNEIIKGNNPLNALSIYNTNLARIKSISNKDSQERREITSPTKIGDLLKNKLM